MQAKRKFVPILLVAALAVFVLAACGGGGAAGKASTLFNLPGLPVNVDGAGNANIYGIGLGPVVPAALAKQLQMPMCSSCRFGLAPIAWQSMRTGSNCHR
ncbi:MAG: hypothetical protein IPK16_22390 [Anaerolineales bacterium]|nr:hypothetical protein [Anaerolineales bacterium]